MDPITHGLLGATLGFSLFSKKLKKSAAWIGGLSAMAPDLDILIQRTSDPFIFLMYHRHFSHALIFIPFGALLCTLIWLLFVKNSRKAWIYVYCCCFIGYGSHGLLDACTTYGTLLLWPFTEKRFSWDIIFIIDPVFTIILLIGVIASYRTLKAIYAQIALALAALYLLFGVVQHERALNIQKHLAEQRNQILTNPRVYPLKPYLFGYRSIYISKNQIFVDSIYFSLFGSSEIEKGITKPLFTDQDLPKNIFQNKKAYANFQTFLWFSDGYISAISFNPLIVADMRSVIQFQPVKSIWAIKFLENHHQPQIKFISWEND